MTIFSSSAQVDYTSIQNKPTTIDTASYVATSSWAINAVSSSYVVSASYAVSSSYVGVKVLNESMSNFNYQELLNYLSPIHYKNSDVEFGVNTYAKGVTTTTNPYQGGIYSPTQNRIYLVPGAQAAQTNWHYIDCNTGTVVAYASGSGAVAGAYRGGIYSPTQNRIYFAPYSQANQTNWHYIDCNGTGSVVTYASGSGCVTNAYSGGTYSPTQNRIYFAPYSQATSSQANWHYIDCATGNAVAYSAGSGTVSNAYQGGSYSPTQNRIYFSPAFQSVQSVWHYIDCTGTGSVVAYTNIYSASIVTNGYIGSVYSPTNNHIYLVPYSQGNQTTWHYIDCTGTGSIVPYTHNTAGSATAYWSGVYSPTQNRIYFVPLSAGNNLTNWHYIQEYSTAEIAPSVMASPLFNKY